MKKPKQLTNKEVKQEVLFWLKGIKPPMADDPCTDLETIVDDYIKCIKYLLNGRVVPIIGFREGVHEWLMTDSDGDLALDSIPHDNGELTECRYEIEALIVDNGYDDNIILFELNKKIHAIS